MQSKKILFGDEARAKLTSGIDKISRAVGSTMGARGMTVLIQSEAHTHGITSTKDGVTVAKSIHLKDPTEDMAVRLIRQAAERTASVAGDGTTTSVVLANAIIKSAIDHITPDSNVVEVCRAIQAMSESVIQKLDDLSIKVNDENLIHVATVSANNDEIIGGIISKAYNSVGEEGVVKVANSKNAETFSKETSGITFDRGLVSPYVMTDFKKRLAEHENCLVLVTDLKIPSLHNIKHLIDYSVESNRPLIIIGELEMDAQSTINHNVHKGVIKCCYVIPPSFGDMRSDMMSDIALSVGAKYISERTGTSWESVTFKDLGSAPRVVIDMDSTSIIHGDNVPKEVDDRISDLKDRLKDETSPHEKGALRGRISMLCGKVSTIFVGAETDVEQKEKRDRVDDAVLATRAAIEEGILPGGGIALIDCSNFPINGPDPDTLTAASILSEALIAPFKTILENAGKDHVKILEKYDIGDGNGYNVKSSRFDNMIDTGIIDPAKVTKSALRNAVSVATTIMMTSAIITNDEA